MSCKISIKISLAIIGASLTIPVQSQELQPEDLSVAELKDNMQPHWVWLNDIAFTHMSDGRAYLVDADTGRFLGMVSAGLTHAVLQLQSDGASFAMPSTYYSRGTRGERTDVVTFYDIKTLAPTGEVEIPAKRFQASPFLSSMPVTDDGRFSLIYNFTPAQSVTVVDLQERKFVGEYDTAGCGLIYPTGPRSFFMQCADGTLQTATLSKTGGIILQSTSEALFEQADPAMEAPVRLDNKRWLFFTFSSLAVIVDASGTKPIAAKKWPLLGKDDSGWRIGGTQPTAYHAATGRLYTLMHQGGPGM